MTLAVPYPSELLRIAGKVTWDDRPEQTLERLVTSRANLTAYGSAKDLAVTRRYVPTEELRKPLENAPAGLFTNDAWQRWHEQPGMPPQPLPRRRLDWPEPCMAVPGAA